MRSAILIAMLILMVGAGAGFTANLVNYHMPWVKPEKRLEPPPPTPLVNHTPTTKPVGTNGQSPATANADLCAPQPGDKPWTVRIDCVLSLLKKPGSAFIIDAREDHDWKEGHLRSAIHLPSSAIYANVQSVMNSGAQLSDLIIVYCGGGDCEASHNVADALRDDFHFTRVYVYEKGWQEITSSGKFADYIESDATTGSGT